MNDIGDLYLASRNVDDVQFSHELTDAEDAPMPWRDYRPGDRVPTLTAGAGVTPRRVMQIATSFGPGSVSLEMGSILATAEETFERKIARLLPGESSLT